MDIDKPRVTYLKYKDKSRLQTCRKTLIVLHPTTLQDGQTVVVAFEQKSNYDKLIFKINRKWSNQVHSKKGIGSWLNLTSWIKKSLTQIDLDDLQSILLKRPPIKKYAQQKRTKKDEFGAMTQNKQLLYFQAKQSFSLVEEKNQVIIRLLIQIVRDHSVLIKTKTRGYQVTLLKDGLVSLKDTIRKLHIYKEYKRISSQKLCTVLSPDHLSQMVHLRQKIEDPNSSFDLRDESLRCLYDWTTIFLDDKHEADHHHKARRKGRRNDFHPVVNVSPAHTLNTIAEAVDMVLGNFSLQKKPLLCLGSSKSIPRPSIIKR